jgi:putative cardiolipin synthase
MILAYLVAGLIILLVAAVVVTLYGAQGQRDMGANGYALPTEDDGTELDRRLIAEIRHNAGKSGIRIVNDDLEAFRFRLDLAREAGRSLDLQYYYWKSDVTGKLLAREILAAADRGVRVRLMLDDINSMGLDSTYLALNTHPKIEVRLFNPSRSRTSPTRRGIELAIRYFSATRRMHNKCWIADGRVAIVGGRNIGDAYFGAATGASFSDIDVLLAGKAVADAERIFDSYWNSDATLPVTSLHRMRRGKLAKLRYRLTQHSASYLATSYTEHTGQRFKNSMVQDLQNLEWMEKAEVIADPPEKAKAAKADQWIARRISELMSLAQRELLLSSPYFIPGPDGLSLLRSLQRRNVTTQILTNSLAATDVMLVHSAYAKYRLALVESGITLFEQKSSIRRTRISLFGSRTASLHTKACVADRKFSFVGSFNLDPRSKSINTEMGIIFESDTVSNQLAELLQTQMQGGYRLASRNGRIIWLEDYGAIPTVHTTEPHSPLTRRMSAWLVGLLPVESQL